MQLLLPIYLQSDYLRKEHESIVKRIDSPLWRALFNSLNEQIDDALYKRLKIQLKNQALMPLRDPQHKESQGLMQVAMSAMRNTGAPTGFFRSDRDKPELWLALFPKQDGNLFHLSESCILDLGRSEAKQRFYQQYVETHARQAGSSIETQVFTFLQRLPFSAQTYSRAKNQLRSKEDLAFIRSLLSNQMATLVFERHIAKALHIEFGAHFKSALKSLWFGSWSSDWLPVYEFLFNNFDLGNESTKGELRRWLMLAEEATAFSFFEGICFVSDRPEFLACDEQGRLHHESGKAISFSDGFNLFSWHGVTCTREFIERPEKITISMIEAQNNAELRRILIERFGASKYILATNAQLIDESQFGSLYVKQIPGDEPLTMLRVVNSTPEPDGTFREYFLRVPPDVKTAHDAVAWTFDLKAKQYNPARET